MREDAIGGSLASAHARGLFDLFGLGGAPAVASDHPALAWRRAGLMAVTGQADGPGLVAPVALTAAADGALAALRALAPDADLPANGAVLLGERARFFGLTRRGAVSANGGCRLLRAQGGWIALNLPRPEDWELVPALLGGAEAGEAGDWAALAAAVAGRPRAELLAQGRLLGLAIAADRPIRAPLAAAKVTRLGPGRRHGGAPVVVDLSALWAGPLAGSLLQAAGAHVIKVESIRRPDGAAGGDARFFELLNGGKTRVALDFADAADLARLRRMVGQADIVIESTRPRALAALGIDAETVVRGGATWLSITAHGRWGVAAGWAGFGDDAAVAGGLSGAMRRAWGARLFAGDAIADPLTGITAAFAGRASWLGGGGRLVSLALAEVVAHAAGAYEAGPAEVRRWQAMAAADAESYPLRC